MRTANLDDKAPKSVLMLARQSFEAGDHPKIALAKIRHLLIQGERVGGA